MLREIKNLKKAAERIKKAIKNKEKIILYGDADLDGVCSVIILEETIQNLGGKIYSYTQRKQTLIPKFDMRVYFPDREIEGYGITKTGLNYLKKYSTGLLIALDLGIGNFKEVDLAKKLGFEVIIIDHHEVLNKLPKADIIINPKQKGDKYPFKELATVGIVFKFSEILLKNKLTKNLKNNFLELVALATLADMMPKKADNEVFIKEGLISFRNSWRPGIRVFLESEYFNNYPELTQKISKIISILNIRDVENNLPVSYRILTAHSIKEAEEILKVLIKKSEQRKEKIKKILEEIEKRILEKKDPLIFEGDVDFDFTLISSVASFLCKKYQKPTFIYKKLKRESQGTVRTPSGINSVLLMKKCSKNLLTYGGHPLASGFRIKNKNLEKFKKCLIKNLCEK